MLIFKINGKKIVDTFFNVNDDELSILSNGNVVEVNTNLNKTKSEVKLTNAKPEGIKVPKSLVKAISKKNESK